MVRIPIQIALRDVGPSEALTAVIRREADRIGRFHPRIASCRIVVTRVAAHADGQPFEVHIDVRVPAHDDIVSTMQRGSDVGGALRNAVDSIVRRIEDAERMRRGETRRTRRSRRSLLASLGDGRSDDTGDAPVGAGTD